MPAQNNWLGYPDAGATATTLVANGYDYYINQANTWLTQAQYQLTSLANIQIEPVQFGTGFSLTNIEQAFERPDRPDTPSVPLVSTAVPDLPTLAALVLKSAGDAPEDPDLSGLLGYAAPARPNSSPPTRPNTSVQLIDVEVAGRDPIQIPVPPTLEQLGVIAHTPIQFQAFGGVRPTFNIPVPTDGQLDFQEIEYTPALAGAIQTALTGMLQGELGLPPHIEQAMFDRARAREDRLSRKQVQEVSEDMSNRNLTEPNGILAGALRQVRGDNREKVASLNQNLTIEVARIGVENVRTGIAQGIAWEQVLISKAEAQNARALQVAIFAREYGLKRVDALVAIANLEQAAYATDAQVWKTLIEGEVAKLAELEAQIKLEALKGTINENLIRQYEAQWKGVIALGEFYRTDVEAAKVKSSINKDRIDAAEVAARIFGHEVEAWGKERESHRWDVEASLAPLKAAETLSGVFAQRMVGYKTKAEAFREENRAQLDANGQSIDLVRLALQRMEQLRLSETANVDAILRRFAATVGLYQADGALAQAESASRDRVTSLAIEQNRAYAEVTLKGQELTATQLRGIYELLLSKNKALADAFVQVVAASQSAVHLGANISASASGATNFNFQGEV